MEKNQLKAKRGVYLLPSILTTFGLFCGFYAVIASIKGEFGIAAIAIFLAMLWDALDGRVARMTNTQSAFGAEYDSMADLVSFGVAPAMLMYHWVLSDLGKLGWIAAFIYVVCASLRLARFNTQIGIADKRYFQGLPSPAAAAVLAGMIMLHEWFLNEHNYTVVRSNLEIIGWVMTVVCGIVMVSNLRYYSFKEINLRGKSSFKFLLLAALIIVIIASKPSLVLFLFFFVYLLSGPVLTVIGLQQKRRQKKRSKSV